MVSACVGRLSHFAERCRTNASVLYFMDLYYNHILLVPVVSFESELAVSPLHLRPVKGSGCLNKILL